MATCCVTEQSTHSHTDIHTHKLHAIGQVHCVAIKWEPQRAWSVAPFQPRCRRSDHFSKFLVQPLCYLALIAAWRRHFGALEAWLLERAEYKRAESSDQKNNNCNSPAATSTAVTVSVASAQWPRLSLLTQLSYICQLSISEKWSPAATIAFIHYMLTRQDGVIREGLEGIRKFQSFL